VRSKRLGLCAMAVAAVAWLPISAEAAVWTRITIDPGAPHVNETLRLTVFTFTLTSNKCSNDPQASPDPVDMSKLTSGRGLVAELAMWALGPNSEVQEIRLEQRKGNGAFWDGSAMLPSAGQWLLAVTFAGQQPDRNPSEGAYCSGWVRSVEILPPGAVPSRPATATTPSESATGSPLRQVAPWLLLIPLAVLAALWLRLALSRRPR